jgi:hypothetical protein
MYILLFLADDNGDHEEAPGVVPSQSRSAKQPIGQFPEQVYKNYHQAEFPVGRSKFSPDKFNDYLYRIKYIHSESKLLYMAVVSMTSV